MVSETALRRNEFLNGTTVLLADGQPWTIPGPVPGRGPGGFGAAYHAALQAIEEAEDEPDRLRSELVLAICLLGSNYRLTPTDYQRILRFVPDDPALPASQVAFRAIGDEHLRSSQARAPRPSAEPRPSAVPRPAWFSRMSRRASAEAARR